MSVILSTQTHKKTIKKKVWDTLKIGRTWKSSSAWYLLKLAWGRHLNFYFFLKCFPNCYCSRIALFSIILIESGERFTLVDGTRVRKILLSVRARVRSLSFNWFKSKLRTIFFFVQFLRIFQKRHRDSFVSGLKVIADKPI